MEKRIHLLTTKDETRFYLGVWGTDDLRERDDRLDELNGPHAEGGAALYQPFAVLVDDPAVYDDQTVGAARDAHKRRLIGLGAVFDARYRNIFTFPAGSTPTL